MLRWARTKTGSRLDSSIEYTIDQLPDAGSNSVLSIHSILAPPNFQIKPQDTDWRVLRIHMLEAFRCRLTEDESGHIEAIAQFLDFMFLELASPPTVSHCPSHGQQITRSFWALLSVALWTSSFAIHSLRGHLKAYLMNGNGNEDTRSFVPCSFATYTLPNYARKVCRNGVISTGISPQQLNR